MCKWRVETRRFAVCAICSRAGDRCGCVTTPFPPCIYVSCVNELWGMGCSMTDLYVVLSDACEMTHSCVWHDSLMCVTWHGSWGEKTEDVVEVCDNMVYMYVWHMTHWCVRHDSWGEEANDSVAVCYIWLIHVCDMTHWCMRHDSWQWVMYDMCVWHDSLMYVSWFAAMNYELSCLMAMSYDNLCMPLHSWHGEANDGVAVCHI